MINEQHWNDKYAGDNFTTIKLLKVLVYGQLMAN